MDQQSSLPGPTSIRFWFSSDQLPGFWQTLCIFARIHYIICRGLTSQKVFTHNSPFASQAEERREVVCARETCAACPVRSDGTMSATTGRVWHGRPQAAHEALQARRQDEAFRQASRTRAGIEGTRSQAVRRIGRRRARSDGWHKTQVQHQSEGHRRHSGAHCCCFDPDSSRSDTSIPLHASGFASCVAISEGGIISLRFRVSFANKVLKDGIFPRRLYKTLSFGS